MKFDPELVPQLGSSDTPVTRSLSQDGDDRRLLSATLSDPSHYDSDLPPVGHVRVSAKYDSHDGTQEPSRRRPARVDGPPEDIQIEAPRRRSSGI